MKRFSLALLLALIGYAAGAFASGWLIATFSSNRHDRSTEAAMAGAFIWGPLVALVVFITAFVLLGRRS